MLLPKGFGWKNGPAVYSSGPDVSVRVPLDGVEAKLSIAMKRADEPRRKAAKMRGLKQPVSFEFRVFIGRRRCWDPFDDRGGEEKGGVAILDEM
jgi:hypothetical protein